MARENFVCKEKQLFVMTGLILILSVSFSIVMAAAIAKENLDLKSVQLNYIPPEGMVKRQFHNVDNYRILVAFFEDIQNVRSSASIHISRNPLALNVNDAVGNINASVQSMGKPTTGSTISPVEKIKIGGQEGACVEIFEKLSNTKLRRCDILLDGAVITFEYFNAPENFDKALPVFQKFMESVEIKSLSVKAE